jgi:hypothetical protein
MAIAMAATVTTVTIVAVAAGAIGRGATLDTTEIDLTAAVEAVQSAGAIEVREMSRTACDIARRCASEDTGR